MYKVSSPAERVLKNTLLCGLNVNHQFNYFNYYLELNGKIFRGQHEFELTAVFM